MSLLYRQSLEYVKTRDDGTAHGTAQRFTDVIHSVCDAEGQSPAPGYL
jgi:hypothetical protein